VTPMSRQLPNGAAAVQWSIDTLKTHGVKVDAGKWQGVPTEGKPDLITLEILDLDVCFPIPHTMQDAQDQLTPNLPWAEDHFHERVSRVPSNPGEQYKNWPWWRGQEDVTRAYHETQGQSFQFSHTYQERFWPKHAGGPYGKHNTKGLDHDRSYSRSEGRLGIRYRYGDLDDVVNLLRREPQTRQAYFPIFFPEDTGATHGGRIPCTLGYHFLLRSGLLHCWYEIRSCDAVRHFRDDLYLATRLVQWVIAELVEKELRQSSSAAVTGSGPGLDSEQVWVDVEPGTMFFKAHSFHVHMGDRHLL
jgi:hypothetical protein